MGKQSLEDMIHDAEWRIGSYIASGGTSSDQYVLDQIEKIRGWNQQKESRYMTYIGKRVTVTFPHYGRIQRVLCQDWQGLYVKYKGHRVSVRPDTTAMGEILPGYYIGLHPKLMK